ncbi:hypothetical protein EA658_09945 [Pseudoxanthomonas winnipegensis]|uniref:Uncharacterized protein n=1 Tax=Pseudoxanthomonas winnipegensis TaxID=2480810 RepID=A0ABY1WCW6_9GAMM|nr:hypothetical protein [Pseudoxanthomonas winnipegensis]TAA12447.1 hypothetical protein EA659_03705 [Pseudoxanthomonas winnipegensis]TAA19188.1 hypothetical protein EA658_09945 [Pseudoxanthomonas winnipegensis]TAH70449.1 hypothetical protein EA657_17010 [Pseudoxanthomonas winnipegensis]
MATEPLNLRPYHRELVLWALHNAADPLSAAEIHEWAGALALQDGKEGLDGWQGPRVGGLLKELRGQGIVADQPRRNLRSGRSEPVWALIGAKDPSFPFPKLALQLAPQQALLPIGDEDLMPLVEGIARTQASLETLRSATEFVASELDKLRQQARNEFERRAQARRAGGAAR